MQLTETETYLIKQLQKSCNLSHIPIYRNGLLIKITDVPDDLIYDKRQYAYNANIFISDELIYNLDDIESIKKLSIPKFDSSAYSAGVTKNLAYILKMRTCSEKDARKSLYLCYKSASLMANSKIGWQKKDYMMLIEHLWKVGEIKEADKLENMMKEKLYIFDDIKIRKNKLNETLRLAQEFNTDLLVSSSHSNTCRDCSILQNRVYSISGKNKNFPVLPKQVFEFGSFHKGCRHLFFPFIENINTLQIQKNGTFVNVDPIKYSNRPYVDERCSDDIKQYNEYKTNLEIEKRKMHLKREYYFKKAENPNSVPKSFYAYLTNNM